LPVMPILPIPTARISIGMWSNKLHRPWFTLLLAFSLFFSISSFGQRKPDTRHFAIEQINVNGSRRYSPQAVIAALGLRVGQQASQAELEQVSAKLGSSGLFDVVEFRFGWGTNGVVATFNVVDGTKLVPIGFENLVWFSANELATDIKKKLPLFTGVVPLAGDYKDQIAKALQQILTEHKLSGTITTLPQGAAGRIDAMLYRVDGNEIKVTSCEFPGAEHANELELSELAKYIMGMRYEKSFVDASLQTRLKDIYDRNGYLNVHSDRPELKVLSTTPDRTEIALTTKVTEGQQYKYGGAQWSGNTVLSAAELNTALKFGAGQIASMAKFRDALTNVRRLYGRQGYLGLGIDFTPQLRADGTAEFKVTVTEGDQYAVGKLSITGLDAATMSKMMSEWNLRTGNVYDSGYPQLFMATKFGKYAPNLKWEWRNVESIHEETKSVDLVIEIQLNK
jgi:outer membrane protein assembly factor BamA